MENKDLIIRLDNMKENTCFRANGYTAIYYENGEIVCILTLEKEDVRSVSNLYKALDTFIEKRASDEPILLNHGEELEINPQP